jgi:hypothetical protein
VFSLPPEIPYIAVHRLFLLLPQIAFSPLAPDMKEKVITIVVWIFSVRVYGVGLVSKIGVYELSL